jgi:hypothetical protein
MSNCFDILKKVLEREVLTLETPFIAFAMEAVDLIV